MKFNICLAVILLFLEGAAGLWASLGYVDDSFHSPRLDGEIRAVGILPDGKILIGGLFTTVNDQARRSLARLNADGSLDEGWTPTRVEHGVTGLLILRTGQIFLYGSFTNIAGVERLGVARLNQDGSLDATFSPPEIRDYDPTFWLPPVPIITRFRAVELPDGGLIVHRLNMRSREWELVKLNAGGALDPSFSPAGVSAYVNFAPDGRVLARLGGEPHRFLDEAGQPIGPSFPGVLVFIDDQGSPVIIRERRMWEAIQIVGAFERYHLNGEWDQNFGPAIPPFHPRMSDSIWKEAPSFVSDSAGGFYFLGHRNLVTYSPPYLAHVTRSGKVELILDDAPDGRMALQSPTRLLVAHGKTLTRVVTATTTAPAAAPEIISQPHEAFGRTGTRTRVTLHVRGEDLRYRWLRQGTNFIETATPDLIWPSLKLADDGFYALDISNANGSVTSEPIRVTTQVFAAGEHDPTFRPEAPSRIDKITVQSDGIITVATSSNTLLQYTPDGQANPRFRSRVMGAPVKVLLPSKDGKLIVGGNFGLTRLLPSGYTDATFTPEVTGVIMDAVEDSAQRLYVVGALHFKGLPGGFARLLPNGQIDGALSSSSANLVRLDNAGRIVLGGAFSQFNGVASQGLVRLFPTDLSVDVSFDFRSGIRRYDPFAKAATLTDLVISQDGSYLVAGAFAALKQKPAEGIVKILPNGDAAWDYIPHARLSLSFSLAPTSLAEQPDGKLIVAGGRWFHAGAGIDGGPHPVGLFRLNSDGSLDPSFTPTPGIFHAIALEPSGDILAAGDAHRLIRVFGSDPGRRLAIPKTSSEQFTATILTLPGAEYNLESAVKLEGPWKPSSTSTGTGKWMTLHPEDEQAGSKFFRLRLQTPEMAQGSAP